MALPPTSTQLFTAATFRAAATLAAALDAGLFPSTGQRILVVSHHAATPEASPALDTLPGFARLRGRFDRVVSWNETIRPFHPGGWEPRPGDVPLWERQLRLLWGLGNTPVELITESPAQPLAQLFPDAPVDVYAPGLAGYGPTPHKLDGFTGTRVGRLLHLDLLPGVEPLLLTEFGVPPEPIPGKAFRGVLSELAAPEASRVQTGGEGEGEGAALVIGECAGLRAAYELGHRDIVAFRAGPSAALKKEAGELGVRLTVVAEEEDQAAALPEVLYERLRPPVVIGRPTTALLIAHCLYGLPVIRTGTEPLLGELTPYENGDRIPLTVADALLPGVREPRLYEDPAQLGGLLRAVAFCMQPTVHPASRAAAERYLSAQLTPRTRRYFTQRRLASLGLPGGLPSRLSFLARSPALRRTVRRARALRTGRRTGRK
ncbi:hypothetical protein [Streptomyces gobiensis]|uniref:hypothetical protein n=1 Tax=Streptomyces gobiensis TaxID=2875706 RepID=UPI001E5049FA|nr:hypothetical protein [Streptomyces gobiensis]UGY93270.1 hypothetical protein test1122_17145 [Streptomyces gobiensis]